MPRLTAKKVKTFFVPNDEDSGSITIRALSKNEIARIEADSIETIADDSGASLRLNVYKRINGIAVNCLEDWANFFDERKQAMPFNAKNRTKAADMAIKNDDGIYMRFFEWVDKCHAEFQEQITAEMEEAEKN